MSEFAIDFETVPNRDVISMLPEFDAGRLVDPVKIAKKEAERKDKMALNPFYGRICSYSAFGDDINQGAVLSVLDDEAERAIVIDALSLFSHKENNSPRVVTWNGNGFDLPFMFKRAMILGIDAASLGVPPLSFWSKRYVVIPHCDLMQVFCGWTGYLKLDDAARIILGQKKIEIDVTLFSDMIEKGQRSEVLVYNERDTKLTWDLFKAASGYLF